jgi:hypothetical protein
MKHHDPHSRGIEGINKATLPVGSVAFEPDITNGLRQIWLEPMRSAHRTILRC